MKFLCEAIKASGFTDITEVVHGDCRGADHLGRDWGREQGLFIKSFPAEWDDLSHPDANIKVNAWKKKYDANAGFRRNKVMAEYADAFIILQPNGFTPGSTDMKKEAEKLGKPVYVHTKSHGDYQYHF